MKITKHQILEKLRECYDPEIPINIVDLGLVYEVKIKKKDVYVKLVLTSLGCPLGFYITEEVKRKIKEIDGVNDVLVEIDFDKTWTPDRMSKKAREILGI
ncbi:MAG: metal-sulfur cluster assembly factor [Candidatus Aenigmatarchaeota archaeon]